MKLLLLHILLLNLIIFSFSIYTGSNNKLSSLKDSYIADIELDTFVGNNINNQNSSFYYRLNVLNDTEQIVFDYQSEYGCLYINIKKDLLDINDNDNDFIFCSEGINNVFILNTSEILEKIEDSGKESFMGLNFIIGVGYSPFESDKNFDFDFSLKISLRKPIINIFEIYYVFQKK